MQKMRVMIQLPNYSLVVWNQNDNFIFGGCKRMYKKVLEVKDQLLFVEVQPQVKNNYNELKNSFNHF